MAHALQLKQFLPYRLNDLAERVSRGLAQSYSRDFDLTVAEWRVLATLAEHGAGQARQVA
ncbi:MAG TPA: transcriptional regulator, partial [Halieaceae bacterium]|nr:transcriptional regulator [Halieaceae bacterium]